jgi:hypothetical protein
VSNPCKHTIRTPRLRHNILYPSEASSGFILSAPWGHVFVHTHRPPLALQSTAGVFISPRLASRCFQPVIVSNTHVTTGPGPVWHQKARRAETRALLWVPKLDISKNGLSCTITRGLCYLGDVIFLRCAPAACERHSNAGPRSASG